MKSSRGASAEPRFLGIDGGATKCVAILADAAGKCLGRRVVTGTANLRLMDDAMLHDLLREIATEFPDPTAVGIGLAGVLVAEDRERVRAACGTVWPHAPCWTGNDLETALAAAGPDARPEAAARIIVICGTGSSCFGRTTDGRETLAGGWGHLLGDRGSGHDIALRACRAVFRDYDESGRWPALGTRLLGALNCNSPAEMVAWFDHASKADIAALAVPVFAAAKAGDRTATAIVRDAATELARVAAACARRLKCASRIVDFFLTGSVLTKQPEFARRVARQLEASIPRASVRVLRHEGASGAAAMARQAATPATGAVAGKKRVTAPQPPAPIPVARGLAPTEQRNPRSRHLDRMTVPAAIRLMLEEDAAIPAVLLREQRKISRAIGWIVQALRGGGRLFYVGAGTSGRLGALDAFECPPTFGVAPEMVQAILAGGSRGLAGAKEDAEDDVSGGAQAVRDRGINKRDVVVGIAASGRTPFVWGAMHAARQLGAKTILICFNPGLVFATDGKPDLVIAPNTGPEVLTGSTRLKAGTATKLLLNILTTVSMVRLGKVVENLMVDVQPTNVKLRLRAIRIVRELTGASDETAARELTRNRWQVHTTVKRLRGNPKRGASEARPAAE